ncbi:hypothetical protein [Bradyrhizobium genosp. A]|uniref:hypothetical protein n=1 Tax=Bradyrhizobium genosp. A TaxID=83626 RepID=UPI003CEF43DA
MPNYSNLSAILQGLRPPLTEAVVVSQLAPRLVQAWLNDYGRITPEYDAVETKDAGFSYLFDIVTERLIAAWGLSKGKDASPRAIIASRMKGHPLTNTVGGKRYHRGHAIPHTMGGRTDINLVPQLGAINSGVFQELERLAVSTPGSLYFSYWSYPDRRVQRPSGVEQGCLIAGSTPRIVNFGN